MWQRIIASKLAIALSGLVAGAVSAPLLGRAARPLARRIIKGGIVAQREILRIVESFREELQDISAEAKSELGEDPAQLHRHGDGHKHAHERARA
ncbi:Hypothetical protein A7982_04414 [Minicystis rosea]|nr:Hypothetical protein A7982_04414 [Minicystis rosea]